MHHEARRVRRLRRKVYQRLPVATASRIADLDHCTSYRDIIATVQRGQLGVDSAGAALALCRACIEKGLESWCYEFGFPQIFTHTVTIVEADGVLQVHDAFFNLGYRLSFHDMLQSLRNGSAVASKRAARDRKVYIMDPAAEPERTVRWLEAKADRELEPENGLRRFELAWGPEGFTAICPAIDGVSRALAERGYPGDLQYLMLHPVAVFDGYEEYRDFSTMPLVGGLDLEAPAAALRVASRDLQTERARAAELTATIERLEAQLARSTQLATARDETERNSVAEREAWLQQRVALQAGRNALEGELAKTRSQLAAVVDLRAQRDSQIAQLRAEIEDAAQQLESETKEWGSARLRLETENRHLQVQLAALSHQNEELCRNAALLEGQAIEMTDCIGPLLEEIDQLRGANRLLAAERERASQERAKLEMQVAASPAARFRALRRRLGQKWALPFAAGRVGR